MNDFSDTEPTIPSGGDVLPWLAVALALVAVCGMVALVLA